MNLRSDTKPTNKNVVIFDLYVSITINKTKENIKENLYCITELTILHLVFISIGGKFYKSISSERKANIVK